MITPAVWVPLSLAAQHKRKRRADSKGKSTGKGKANGAKNKRARR